MKCNPVLPLLCLLMIHAGAISQDKSIDTEVHRAASVFMENPARVGLSVGILKDGKTYTYHYGTAVKGKNMLPSDHTLYEIGSITKTITGTLLASAVVENKV